MKKLLVVEDDPDIRELLTYNLSREGFSVQQADNGADGLKLAMNEAFDLVILDLMMPQLSGIEVCKRIRENPETKNLPLIMLTAKGEESDVVFGLGVGADDYMAKPFSVKELVARVYTRIRPNTVETKPEIDIVRHGAVQVDRARFQVKVDGDQVPMTLAEFRLFNALISKPGIVLSRDRLLDAVTGGDGVLIDRNIDVHVRAIRKKLGPSRDLIETVRGLGYKFKEV